MDISAYSFPVPMTWRFLAVLEVCRCRRRNRHLEVVEHLVLEGWSNWTPLSPYYVWLDRSPTPIEIYEIFEFGWIQYLLLEIGWSRGRRDEGRAETARTVDAMAEMVGWQREWLMKWWRWLLFSLCFFFLIKWRDDVEWGGCHIDCHLIFSQPLDDT